MKRGKGLRLKDLSIGPWIDGQRCRVARVKVTIEEQPEEEDGA